MRRPKIDIGKYDFTFPCAHCGYKIPPRELLRVDGEHVRCPKCGKDSQYIKKLRKTKLIPRSWESEMRYLLVVFVLLTASVRGGFTGMDLLKFCGVEPCCLRIDMSILIDF